MTEVRDAEADIIGFRLRVLALAVAVLLGFALLGWRLYTLQVQRYDELAHRSDSNRTAVVPIVPDRGEIFDRNGVVLAANYRAWTLEVTPAHVVGPLEKTLDAVAEVVPVSVADRRRFMRGKANVKPFESTVLRTNLTDEEVAQFAARRWKFPGVQIKARLLRTYPQAEGAGHLLGYVGRINEKDKDRLEESAEMANYRGTEVIGKLGVEAQYERLLHGTTGIEQMETSAGGHAIRELAMRPPSHGDSIALTIDIQLQKLVEDLYGDRRGALVAIDPRNGEVLAFVSKPTYDPNIFIQGFDQETWDELVNSLDNPLLDRALRGTYPIGSTYKPFMALAGLESGLRRTDTVIMDRGSWTLANHTFRSGHPLGRVDLHRSIVKSSNVYYYQLAYDLGIDAMHDFMAPLGFGQITGIDLPGEARGVLPSKAWKKAAFKTPAQQQWFPGETVSAGIGQGYDNFTILQLASATATLANGGVRHIPHVMKSKLDPESGDFVDVAKSPPQHLGYQPDHVQAVLNAMADVTREGTSRLVFASAPYRSGGKTGTAQAVTIGQKSRYDAAKLKEFQRDHSLYIAFAPVEAPRIAVAAIVENAGFGATAAAPVVRRVLDYWLADRLPSDMDLRAVQSGRAKGTIGVPRQATVLSEPEAPMRVETPGSLEKIAP